MPITEALIEQVEKLYGDEGHQIIGDGYTFFDWYLGIEIDETMTNDEE